MKRELRILILEDVPADVALITRELRKAGMDFQWSKVEAKDEFLREIQKNPPDLILSDHGLPQFDGFTALSMAQRQCPDVPFIFVTGSMGEEVAVETLRRGATDYVLKDRLPNLVPAVARALRMAEERRKRAEAERALSESEEQFRMLVEGVRDHAIFMLDPEGLVTSWNPAAKAIFGYPAREIVGRDFACFFLPEETERPSPEKTLQAAVRDGRSEVERQCVRSDGSPFWANLDLSALRDSEGELRGFVCVTRDITERRKTEAAIRESEARKGAILEAALDAILVIDPKGVLQEWNPASERIFGYSRQDALGRSMDELIVPPSVRALYHNKLCDYLLTGVGSLLGRPIEMTMMRSDGSEFPAEVAITRVPLEGPEHYTCFIRDITERKKAQEALVGSEKRLRALIEKSWDAITLVDGQGVIRYASPSTSRILGYATEEFVGHNAFELVHHEDSTKTRDFFSRLLEHPGACVSMELRYHSKDGYWRWLESVSTNLLHEPFVQAIVTNYHDVTAHREAEAEITRLNSQLEQRIRERTAQLEAANQELEAFSYSVSHDLRTPLRHIVGFAQMLQDRPADADREESEALLERIVDSAKRMNQLIDDLLAFSHVARAELNKIPMDLGESVQSVMADFQHELKDREVEWEVGPLPAVDADPPLLRQVLVNLISNALKYTRSRSRTRIEIGCCQGDAEVICYVRDNGVGFDARQAHKLFGVFQRLHRPSEFEGTGIGLANVRRIIHRHGGRTWAEGMVDDGATFYFSLPKPNSRSNEQKSMDTRSR